MHNIKGYVTEKILDCLCMGIVPIYMGASNIDDYVPKDCFIKYESFGSLHELEKYLKEMDEIQYNHFLDAAKLYLSTGRADEVFSMEAFGRHVLDAYEAMTGEIRFGGKIGQYLLANRMERGLEKIKREIKLRL